MVIVVDDGSTDATAPISQQMGAFVIKHTETGDTGQHCRRFFPPHGISTSMRWSSLTLTDSMILQDIEKVLNLCYMVQMW